MLEINDKRIKQLEADLSMLSGRALPYATRNTLNVAAFRAREIAQDNVRNQMILRNRYTERSIQVEKTKSLSIPMQAAIVGSTADYMADQEFGATVRGRGSKGVPIPTSYSAGQDGAKPRTKLTRKPNKLSSIQLKRSRKHGSDRKQRNLVAIREAVQSGRKFVYLNLGRRQGIFRIVGGKRNPAIRMVHDLSSKSVDVPRNPWLFPAMEKASAEIPKIYFKSLRFQIKRLKLLRS